MGRGFRKYYHNRPPSPFFELGFYVSIYRIKFEQHLRLLAGASFFVFSDHSRSGVAENLRQIRFSKKLCRNLI